MLFFNRNKHRDDRVVSLTDDELELLQVALLRFRNRAIRDDIPTDDIDSLIVMLTKFRQICREVYAELHGIFNAKEMISLQTKN